MHRRTLLTILAVAAGLAFLAFGLHEVDFARAAAAMRAAGPLLPLAFLSYGLSILVDSVGFARLLRAIGRRVHPLQLVASRLSSEALALSLPGGALLVDTINPVLLRERCGLPLDEGLGAMAARKCLIVGGHGTYLALAAILGWGHLATRADVVGASQLPWVVLAAALVILSSAATMRIGLRGGALVARLSRLCAKLPSPAVRGWIEGSAGTITGTDVKISRMLELRTGATSLPAYVLMWSLEALESWLLLRLFGFDIGFVDALAIEATVSVVRAFAFFVPAGIGFQDAGYLALLGNAGPGVSVTTAFVLTKRLRELCWLAVGYALLAARRRFRAAA